MNYEPRLRVKLKADFLRLILGARVRPARRSILLEFVETYVLLDSTEQREFNRLVTQKTEYREVEKMITTYERRGIEKGLEKGIEKGIEKGLLEAKRGDLLLLLEKRFGRLSTDIRRRVRRLRAPERLEALLLSVFDVESIEELDL